MIVAETFDEVRRLAAGVVGLVPTMGFLHEGHISLLSAARTESDHVVMSLFVNPLQFDDGADLQSYPRDLERDLALAHRAGVDVVFAPPLHEMYPEPATTRIDVGPPAALLEGSHRPGHFEGVATVVAKLLVGLRPRRAYFGRKDAQQLAVVRRLARDLSFPVDIVAGSTVREPDGLAVSSRNVRLDPAQRAAAAAIPRALGEAADVIDDGGRDAPALERMTAAALGEEPMLEIEYVRLVDADSVQPLSELDRTSFLAVAVRLGDVRLIDNLYLDVLDGDIVPDRGLRLDRASVLYSTAG